MTVLFVSNYFNHHQKSFCDALKENVEKFYFVETDENYQQGYQTRLQESYVLQYHGHEKQIEKLLLDADVVIFGGCPNSLIELRMHENKLSFLYSLFHTCWQI